MTNFAIAYPLRSWLNFLLREMMISDVIPAFNTEIENQLLVDEGRQAQPGFVLPQLTEDTVTLGELHSMDELTLSVVPGGNRAAYGAPTNSAFRNLTTRFLWKIPKAGLNAPEDFAMVQAVFEDLFTNLLLDETRYVLTPTDPDTQVPALPDGASFTQCVLGSIVPLPMPVKTGDGVTYVDGGYCDFTCFFEIGFDRPGRIG
ncbi:MAG: hypothetical protein ACRYFS_16370 [Janthinobacterium lividum]